MCWVCFCLTEDDTFGANSFQTPERFNDHEGAGWARTSEQLEVSNGGWGSNKSPGMVGRCVYLSLIRSFIDGIVNFNFSLFLQI